MTDQPNTPQPRKPEESSPTEPMPAAKSPTPPGPTSGSTSGPTSGPKVGPIAGPAAGPPANPTTVIPTVTPTAATVTSSEAPKANVWQRATSSNRGRWGVAIGAGVLACLMIFGIVVAGLAVTGHNDRIQLAGDRPGNARGQDGPGAPGNGNGPGNNHGNGPGNNNNNGNGNGNGNGQKGDKKDPGMPTLRGGGPAGLGALAGTALHGEVTASANGTVQALVFQRGEVTAVSATSITIKSTDGFTATYKLSDATASRGETPVKGGQAYILAKASDKSALELRAAPAKAADAPDATPSTPSS